MEILVLFAFMGVLMTVMTIITLRDKKKLRKSQQS